MSREWQRRRQDPGFVKEELFHERRARDRAYSHRNQAVVAFARMALAAGWPAGRGWDASPELHDTFRNVVIVDLPDGGQVAWHMSLADVHLLEDLPVHPTGFNASRSALGARWTERVPMRPREERR